MHTNYIICLLLYKIVDLYSQWGGGGGGGDFIEISSLAERQEKNPVLIPHLVGFCCLLPPL